MKKNILIILLLLFSADLFSQTNARLLPKKGLFVTTDHLNWITGSEFNIFTSDKKNHHYYFTWWEQDADSSQNGKDVLFIGSRNTAIDGTYSLEQRGAVSSVAINCNYHYPEAGLAEIVHARIWMPFLKESHIEVRGNKLDLEKISSFSDSTFDLITPFGDFNFSSSHAFHIKRNDAPVTGKSDYSKRDQYLVLYENDIKVDSTIPLRRKFSIIQTGYADSIPPNLQTITVIPEQITNAWIPPVVKPQILPKPVEEYWEGNAFYIIKNEDAKDNPEVVKHYLKLLSRQWQIPASLHPRINAAMNPNLAAEAYELSITKDGVDIDYSTTVGLQYALYSLVQLTIVQNGEVKIPVGKVKDQPKTNWRGIHMFTGPTSLAFHKKMFDNILLPLKINKTVLQCEQAEWKSFPNVKSKISISTANLKSEFDYLRKNNVEPIPLIQSLGHMEWFFKPRANRFMAVNPSYPYTINPLLSQSKNAVWQIWKEAVALLKPATMHIGFDEIGMIGFNQPREREIDYWKIQLAFLDSLSKIFHAKLMLWGDMGLASSEGPDACNGKTVERAAIIRSTIPKGSFIGDWHYLNNADPELYKKSLRIWKKEGLQPLASPWLHPNNIKGFTKAAIEENAGVLQTTWADFESSEKNMLLNIEQFGAYILALDYAWSGRKELPEKLPYNAIEEWCTRFYAEPKPVGSKNGWRINETLQLQNISSSENKVLPEVVELKWKTLSAEGFIVKATTDNILKEGEIAAVMQFFNGGQLVFEKPLRYGVEVRSNNDKRNIYSYTPTKDEKTLYCFFQKKLSINSVRIKNINPASGLKVEALVMIQ